MYHHCSHTWLKHGKAVLEKAIYPKSKAPAETTLRVPFGLGSRRIVNTEYSTSSLSNLIFVLTLKQAL